MKTLVEHCDGLPLCPLIGLILCYRAGKLSR
jgi:hypothetical protein